MCVRSSTYPISEVFRQTFEIVTLIFLVRLNRALCYLRLENFWKLKHEFK